MKRFYSFICLLLGMVGAAQAATIVYTADDTSVFSNPERGFITEFNHKVTESKPWCVKGNEEYLRTEFVERDQISLVLVLYYLDNYKDTVTLPQSVLQGFEDDMQVLRSMGLKAVLRFAYTKSASGDIGYDAPLKIVQSHIAQYASHWQANADVIFCFQAGFVGTWGEWYYSSNFGNKAHEINDARRAVVDALLEAVPADRCIQMRTPLFKTGYIGDTNPLTAAEAYSGSPRARLGHHNDAFLYGPTNMGTYRDTTADKPYVAKETLYVPLGGETDIEDEEQAKTDASHDATVAEMSRMHWTFINSVYSEAVTNQWRANGTFEEIGRALGYRYQLVSGSYSDEVEQGRKLSVKMQIRNAGYAPLYNKRKAYIVLRDLSGQHSDLSLELATDPRRWLPNGAVSEVEEELTIPETMPQGSYRMYLYLPDAYESIADNPRYAVRFANEGVWDEETGMNDLQATVTVKAATTPIEPEPEPEPQPGEAIVLPATLSKANVTAYSENMSWYNSSYFDFGPEDAPNTDRWAEWKVKLQYPGEYIVTAEGFYPNGHQWQLELLNSGAEPYALEATWDENEQTETGETPWNLRSVPAGEYTLRVTNIMEWGQPKLKLVRLQYNGEIPTGVEKASEERSSVKKIIENGILYIVMPNGDKYYCF